MSPPIDKQVLESVRRATIGQLAAGVAHEINNTLTYLTSNMSALDRYHDEMLELLAEYQKLLEECRGREGLEAIVESADRKLAETRPDELSEDLSGVIAECQGGLLHVNQIASNLSKFSEDPEDIAEEDINELLERSIDLGLSELKYRAKVVRRLSPLPSVACFGVQLVQSFLNLLVDVAGRMTRYGELTVETHVEGDHIVVDIGAPGTAASPEELSSIFDAADAKRVPCPDLPLARAIIESHGGSVSPGCGDGQRSLLNIRIPISTPMAEDCWNRDSRVSLTRS